MLKIENHYNRLNIDNIKLLTVKIENTYASVWKSKTKNKQKKTEFISQNIVCQMASNWHLF